MRVGHFARAAEVFMEMEGVKKTLPFLRGMVEAIQDPFILLDPDGMILLSNPKGFTLLGCPPENPPAENFFDFFPEVHRSRVEREFKGWEGKEEVRFAVSVISRCGEEIPVELVGVRKGEVFFITLRDRREKLMTEEEWGRTKRDLFEKVRERDQYSRELQVIKDLYKEKLKEVEKAKEQVEILTYTDELTGIYNRRFFMHLLALEMERQKRYPCPLSLLMIDIDHFKLYNDTNGHLAGDQLLKRISLLIEQAMRETDVVARYGGEEFVAILVNANEERAIGIAERVRRSVAEAHFLNERVQPDGRLTVSIGVAPFSSAMTTTDAFIRKADEALYRAKRGGRNRVAS